ncbi:uncharacterized protein LOC116119724 isoform X2 [Pistacia vera]|uniref:uncharacterized protein LOC116119724 isoform X2 n=1 Tax=Pistacia vera TaxID=55513 RepID=UPI0012638BAB|nr:uncharacterized protein LOC116119724 isoform X2 [Pistacia vera]
MAVLLRCSCFFTRPTALPSPPSDHFSDKPHVPGKLVSLLFKKKKMASFLGNASRVSHQRFDGLHDLEGNQDFSKMPPPHEIFLDKLSADQVRCKESCY